MKNLKYLLTFILFSLPATTLACEVLGPKLIVVDKTKGTFPSHLFKTPGCNKKQATRINSFLADFEGILNPRTLEAETGIKTQRISSTEIVSINSLLNQRIPKDKTWNFIKSNFTGTNSNFLKIEENESLTVSCGGCTNTGLKNVKLEVRDPINSRFHSLWANSELAARTTALFPKENLPVDNKALVPSQFEEKIVYETRPEQFFTDREKLVFYKTNKPKSTGEALKFQDLTPVNLVNMGHPTTVILKNNSLTLETIAIPSQSGKLGQRIRLKNPRTQKLIIGKVIHFNKVEVEL